ncbi:protein RIC-3-like isoform X1 [Scleropages formosus]|uniref:RIC3 acetylcholine receptor chaperone n=2 Tax=Scleropages formosus TaxID=113540 RepID=A0A8C9TLQ2_SCLFO|nr:protein RIC-3-like isoform X1 [Scleropages formosus]
MSMSTFHKVTLVSCAFLCVSVLLPRLLPSRERREAARADAAVGPGHFPPMMKRRHMSEGQAKLGAGQQYARAHNAEAVTRTKGGSMRSSLMGQILPIYGVGIFLYILYVLLKITSKGNNTKPDNQFPVLKSGNIKRKITDYELEQLQGKLKETEEVMEHIMSKAGHHSRRERRARRTAREQEQKLLRQLKEIARVMREGQLVDGISPEIEAEHTHYAEDWEGYPEETYPQYSEPSSRWNCGTIIVEETDNQQPTAEEQAERMQTESQGDEEEEKAGPDQPPDEELEEEGEEPQEQPCTPEALCTDTATEEEEENPAEKEAKLCRGIKQITFSNKHEVFCYLEESSDDSDDTQEAGSVKGEDEEDDPVAVAESLRFSSEACSNHERQQDPEEEEDTEEQTEPEQTDLEDSDELLNTGDSEDECSAELAIAEELGFGSLRKRNRREP